MKIKILIAPIAFATLTLLTACGDPTPINTGSDPTIKQPTQQSPDATAPTARDFQVTGVEFAAEQSQYAGPCPLTVKFSGRIKASGTGQVTYTFVRSDGTTSSVHTMDFSGDGEQPVSDTWTLGTTERLASHTGWQKLKVLSPNVVETSSESGAFSVECQR